MPPWTVLLAEIEAWLRGKRGDHQFDDSVKASSHALVLMCAGWADTRLLLAVSSRAVPCRARWLVERPPVQPRGPCLDYVFDFCP